MARPSLSFGRLTLVPQGATIVFLGFLPILAIVSMFPAVPSIIAHFHASPGADWKVPLMVSAPGLSVALLASFAGVLADKVGRRATLLTATLAYGVIGALPFVLHSLNAVIAARLCLGICEAFILTGVNTLLADYWDDTQRRAWLSIQGMLGPFLAFGLILASGHITGIVWNGSFLIYLVAFPVFAAAYVWLFEPTKDGATAAELSQRADTPPFPWGAVALTGLVTLLLSVLYYVHIINGGTAFLEAGVLTPDALANLTAGPSLFIIVGAYVFWMLRTRSNAVQLFFAFACIGGGLLLMGLLHTPYPMLGGLVIQQTGAGMAIPSLIAWSQTKLPFEHRGRGMGVWAMCFFLGQFISPVVVHQLAGRAGSMHGAFVVAGVAGLAAACVALLAAQRTQPVRVAAL